ncbi:MAG: type II toxin-antitoxin system ParD family antitoxin [Gammaproteobacteria bacterium]|nr:type II toxin-antitoxin system ParD family antitoxin [Gammaproteobacteria bacterium]
MSTMNISLPDALKEFVDNQVGSLGYSSSGEYMRELIRRERDRQHLRGLLLEGAASPQSATADSGYFDELRNRVHAASHR